jgi:hypothetical protein
MVQVPDSAVTITANTVTISLTNAAVVDQFQFPGGAGQNLGMAGVPATVSFTVTYTKSGTPRRVQPALADPLSPFAWSGEMWMATNSGTFTLAYTDGSFAAQGSFSSAGNFGEIGTERNGSFVQDQLGASGPALRLFGQHASTLVAGHKHDRVIRLASSPTLKGKVPLQDLIH